MSKEITSGSDYEKLLKIYKDEKEKKKFLDNKTKKKLKEYEAGIENLNSLTLILERKKEEHLNLSDMEKFVVSKSIKDLTK